MCSLVSHLAESGHQLCTTTCQWRRQPCGSTAWPVTATDSFTTMYFLTHASRRTRQRSVCLSVSASLQLGRDCVSDSLCLHCARPVFNVARTVYNNKSLFYVQFMFRHAQDHCSDQLTGPDRRPGRCLSTYLHILHWITFDLDIICYAASSYLSTVWRLIVATCMFV